VTDSTCVREDSFVDYASEKGELQSQILDGAITIEETVVSESDIMGNNTPIEEEALVENPASENGQPDSQITGEGLIVRGEDLAEVAVA
jgi:hypothetical protein